MPRRSTIVLLTLASVVAFALGAATSFWFFAARIVAQVDNATDSLLVDRTMVLQYLRDGNTQFVEQHVESVAWNQVISVGHRKERGESPSPGVQEAIKYNCRHFSEQRAMLEPKLAEQRAYWCSLFSQ